MRSVNAKETTMGSHINAEGKFQSDRYPTCPAGKVPLSVTDKTAQDLLWEYAQRRRVVDAEFSVDLEACLLKAEFVPPVKPTEFGAPGETGCPLCGEPSVIVRVEPAIVKEQHKAFCTSSSCANARPAPGHIFASGGPIPTASDTRPGFWKPFESALSQQPAPAASSRSRDKDRARAALAEATERVAALERELSVANERAEALQSDVAARQIRETDLAARLLKSERKLREYEEIIARRADERKRGQ